METLGKETAKLRKELEVAEEEGKVRGSMGFDGGTSPHLWAENALP